MDISRNKTNRLDVFTILCPKKSGNWVQEAKCDGGLAVGGMGVPGKVDPVKGISV